MWETMGPIADRSRERLGASDVAIVEFRRIMVEAARAVARRRAGDRQPGRIASRTCKLRSFEGIVPKTTDWTTLDVAAEELAQRASAADDAPPNGILRHATARSTRRTRRPCMDHGGDR